MSLSALLRADLLQLRATRTAAILVVVGLGILVLSNVGLAQAAGKDGSSSEVATLDLVRNGFSLSLFAALFGALFTAGQLATGEGARAWLARPSWSHQPASRATASALVGLAYGIVGAAAATASAVLLLPGQDLTFVFDGSAAGAVAGVVAVNVAAGVWGAVVGTLVLRPALAVGVIVLQMLILEPGLVRIWDTPFQYLLGNAMGGVYGDDQPYSLPSPGVGVAVMLAWLVVGCAVALRVRTRRDVPMSGTSA